MKLKPTDFAKALTDFLSKYLPSERGMSQNTIASYTTTFVLLITYMEKQKGINVEKLELKHFTRESIVEFLEWLQKTRTSSDSTRNVRLAAIHSFFKYLQYIMPGQLKQWQEILSIKVKNVRKESVNYLPLEGVKLLLQGPDQTTRKGIRDLAMLALMYDTGARVQEIIDLTPSSLRFASPCTIKLAGKGKKSRIVPLMDQEVRHLKYYMERNSLDEPYANLYPLFFNSRKEKLTRAGISHILQHYADLARTKNASLIPEKISPHLLRHSKAMHLLQAEVNLVYIRDILGHQSIETTEIYARADTRQKRQALEKAYEDVVGREVPLWESNDNLLEWLKNFQ
jgi:site-specific recombinase XerD